MRKTGAIYSRVFRFLKYPESTTEQEMQELVNRIEEAGLDYAFSIHDCDSKEETGELKKAHIHFLIVSNKPKTIEQIKNIVKENHVIPNIPYGKCLNDLVRYLAHLDEEEKFRYNVENIQANSNWYEEYLEKQENKSEEQLHEERFDKSFNDMLLLNEGKISVYDYLRRHKHDDEHFYNFKCKYEFFFGSLPIHGEEYVKGITKEEEEMTKALYKFDALEYAKKQLEEWKKNYGNNMD